MFYIFCIVLIHNNYFRCKYFFGADNVLSFLNFITAFNIISILRLFRMYQFNTKFFTVLLVNVLSVALINIVTQPQL